MKAGDQTKLISGSLADIQKTFAKLKEEHGNVDFYSLDNGSYSLGLRTKDKNLTKSDLVSYDTQNKSGGNFLYLKGFNEEPIKIPGIRDEDDNSYKKGHPLVNEKKGIVLHHTGFQDPDLTGVINYFKNPTNEAGAHVLIGYDGKRKLLAQPNQVPFHAGVSSWKGRDNVNDYMLGVEFQGNTTRKPLTEAQINSFLEYADPIIRANNIPLENIISHKMISPDRKPDITDKEYKRVMEIVKNYYK